MKKRILINCILLATILLPISALAVEIDTNLFQGIPFLNDNTADSTDYINALYLMAISIASLLVVFRLILAGVQYMLTESVIKKNDAKSTIGNALLGLVIILSAATILQTINPNLNNLDFLENATSTKSSGDAPDFGFDFGVQKFGPGEEFSGVKIVTHCKEWGGPRDYDCEHEYVEALKDSCEANGGIRELETRTETSVNLEWIGQYYIFTCLTEETYSLNIPGQ